MRNEEIDVYKKYFTSVIDYSYPLIQKYKPYLTHQDNTFLLDLCINIMAYDFAFLMQARADFTQNNLEGKRVEDFVNEEKEIYGNKNIKRVISSANNNFRSSFDNQRSKKIKELIVAENLMRMVPGDEESISLYDDFRKNWFPQYNPSRKNIAFKTKEKFHLTDDLIRKLQILAFDEIVNLANKKQKEIYKEIVEFLELAIVIYFPIFFKDLYMRNRTVSLLTFRKNTKRRYNTVCNHCGLQLYKKDNKYYCTRKENRSCYLTRFKEVRNSGFPKAILRTKNRCDNCNAYSSLDYTHNHKGKAMQFCSDQCWEVFRKRDLRKSKKQHQK